MRLKKLIGGFVLTLVLLGAAGPGVALAGITVTQANPGAVVVGGNDGVGTPGVIEAPCAAESGTLTSLAAIAASPNPLPAALPKIDCDA